MSDTIETSAPEAEAPKASEATPAKGWDDAQFRAVTRERSEWRTKAQETEAKAKALEEQLNKLQSEQRRKSLEWDVLRGLPEDRHEPARHLLLGAAVSKGLDFSRDIDADTSSALREYVVSQFAVQAQSAQSAPPAPKAPPVAQPPAPMMAADHDWSKQATLNGLTNDQRLQFASKNPEGYQRALRDQFRSR
jgi:hypothetical protein